MTPEKLLKLPKWAQKHIAEQVQIIAYLQRDLDLERETQKQRAEGNTQVTLDDGQHDPWHVSNNMRIRFLFGDPDRYWNNFIEASLSEYRSGIPAVHLYSGTGMLITPHSTNMAYVQLVPKEWW